MSSDSELDEALKLRKLGHNGIKFFDNAHPGYAQYFALYQDMVDLYGVASDLVSQLEVRRAEDRVVQSGDVRPTSGDNHLDRTETKSASQTQSGSASAEDEKKVPFSGVKTFLSNFFD